MLALPTSQRSLEDSMRRGLLSRAVRRRVFGQIHGDQRNVAVMSVAYDGLVGGCGLCWERRQGHGGDCLLCCPLGSSRAWEGPAAHCPGGCVWELFRLQAGVHLLLPPPPARVRERVRGWVVSGNVDLSGSRSHTLLIAEMRGSMNNDEENIEHVNGIAQQYLSTVSLNNISQQYRSTILLNDITLRYHTLYSTSHRAIDVS